MVAQGELLTVVEEIPAAVYPDPALEDLGGSFAGGVLGI
jgi:hypothetical protein